MDDSILTAASVVGAGATLVGGVLAANSFSTARLLGATGPTPMAELSARLHEVRGTLEAEESRVAPLSGRTCVFWRLLVEEQRRTRWDTVLEQRDGAPAFLDDGTGRVRIDPREAEPVATAAGRVRTGVFAHPSSEWTDLVARLGGQARTPSTPFLRWREEIFEAGDTLTAIGKAQQVDGVWEIVPEQDQFILSDRDDAQVVRQHRRAGRRWAGVAAGGAALLAWGATSLFG